VIGRLALLCALVALLVASARTEPLQVSLAQQAATSTPSRTPTATATATITATATAMPSSPTPTRTPPSGTSLTPGGTSLTPIGTSLTPLVTHTPTRASTQTITPTASPTRTTSPTATVKPTASTTPTITATAVPPLFTAIDSSSVTRSSATITWTTNVPASSQVEYGVQSVGTLKSTPDSSLVTGHRAVLTGLSPATTYQFRVRGVSASGAAGVSPESILVTAPAGSGPEVADQAVSQVTSTTATVTWATSTGTVGQVEYGATADYGQFTLLRVFTAPTQQMTIDGLRPSTAYHYRVKAWDGGGFLGASPDRTFRTAAAGVATLVGDDTVQTEHLSLLGGQAAAYQYVASQSGQASVIRLYSDGGSSTPVIRVALYADQDGVPGTMLSQGSAPALVPGWINVAIPPVNVLESTRYWVAVLSPLGSGTLNLRQAAIGGSSVTSTQTSLAALPAVFSVGASGARSPLSVYVQQVPPAITLTAPLDGSTVGGWVQLSALVDDDMPLTRLQFFVDGVPVGAPVAAAPYTATWDSSGWNANLPHTISARATDLMGRSGASGQLFVQVDNGPVISSVSMSPGLTVTSARITWTTDVLSDAQVEFGPTTSYGASTAIDARPDWHHSMQLTGLAPGTQYHYRVRSRDANGALAVSADQVFFTP
jgi:hypothetical protein